MRELHDAIQQQLTESHVQYFSDLSEAEKELFMQRATKALEGGIKLVISCISITSLNYFIKIRIPLLKKN